MLFRQRFLKLLGCNSQLLRTRFRSIDRSGDRRANPSPLQFPQASSRRPARRGQLDDQITQALNALGRSGVPVYVLYRPGQPPEVLSELPTVDEILTVLR